ncbi:MAG: adenine phosphoribosyltransferase, partial [Flavobacteriales bacterium CG_4_9_14_0_2_um_filter_35_242]
MKVLFFKIFARFNKLFLPSLAKKSVDLSKAKKWQMLLIAWRYYITKNGLN